MVDPRALARTWLDHLTVEQGLSANTLSNYRRDLRRYLAWLEDAGLGDLDAVEAGHLEHYVADLQRGDKPLAPSSAARALIVARGLHKFGAAEGQLTADVAAGVSPPQQGKHLPETLSIAEVTQLLEAIPTGEAAGPVELRDAALLELLYGTGARVTEITSLVVDDVAELVDGAGYLTLTGKGSKQRIVPVGSKAVAALEAYLVRGRPALSTGKSHALLLNTRGGALSRQSAWAILQSAAV